MEGILASKSEKALFGSGSINYQVMKALTSHLSFGLYIQLKNMKSIIITQKY